MIGFIGLSHLGLNYSLATAAKGMDVLCYDPDASLVERLQEGVIPIEEPGFQELFGKSRARITFSSEAADLAKCGLVFYALDVRTNEANESDLGPLTGLIEKTSQALSKDAVAVVMSQVRPGYMRSLVGRTGFGPERWFYQVETLIFGAAVKRAMEPERFIVGAAEPAAALPRELSAWQSAFGCPVLVMRYESAELAKIAINLFLVSTVSTTNTLAELCETIGADWTEIAPALRLDKRIGPHAYLKPGLGIAGGNLERDLVTVRGLAAGFGTEAGVVDAWIRNSAHAKSWALRILARELTAAKPTARIAVWGLAYKQDTHSIKNSASLELMRALPECRFQAYDPAARVDPSLFPHVTLRASALETLADSDALVVMTPWREFSAIAPSEVRKRLAGKLVVDPFASMSVGECSAAGLRCLQIGRP